MLYLYVIMSFIRYMKTGGCGVMDLDSLPWKDIFTVGAAGVGAVLGVMNTWHSMNQRRVRLRVRPAYGIAYPVGQPMLSIEVVNLSSFAVTVTEVGFSSGRHHPSKSERLAVVTPVLIDGKPWPRRLEPREAVSAYCDPTEVNERGDRVGRAYARTSCGEWRTGDSPALKQVRRELRQ